LDDKRLSQLVEEALQARDRMRADGVSEADIAAGFERLVRDAWPTGREWHYYCEQCQDTGLVIYRCKPGARCNGVSTRTDGPFEKAGKYQRLCAKFPDSDYEHEYGEPCQCRNGSRFKSMPKAEGDDLGDAARKPKPKPFTRFGR
jgi:hypothetical protein